MGDCIYRDPYSEAWASNLSKDDVSSLKALLEESKIVMLTMTTNNNKRKT